MFMQSYLHCPTTGNSIRLFLVRLRRVGWLNDEMHFLRSLSGCIGNVWQARQVIKLSVQQNRTHLSSRNLLHIAGFGT